MNVSELATILPGFSVEAGPFRTLDVRLRGGVRLRAPDAAARSGYSKSISFQPLPVEVHVPVSDAVSSPAITCVVISSLAAERSP